MSDERGHIVLMRRFFAGRLWSEKRRFSRPEAWLDLIAEAAWRDHEVQFGLRRVWVRRGEVIHSVRTLSQRWGWGRSAVQRFLDVLKAEHALGQRTERGVTLYLLVNYDEYQRFDSEEGREAGQLAGRERDSSGTAAGQTENKENKEEETKVSPSPEKPTDTLTIGQALASETMLRWNQLATELKLSCIQALSAKRRKGLNARKADGMLDRLEEIFDLIRSSAFLQGQNDRGWRIDFDWLFCSSNNWLKVVEGKYQPKQAQAQQSMKFDPSDYTLTPAQEAEIWAFEDQLHEEGIA